MFYINILDHYCDADEIFSKNPVVSKSTESILNECTNLVGVIKDFDSSMDASPSARYTFDCQACLQHLFLGGHAANDDFILATESVFDSLALFKHAEHHQDHKFPAHSNSSILISSNVNKNGFHQVTVSACCGEMCNGPNLYALWKNSALLCAMKTTGYEPAGVCLFPDQILDLWKDSV